MDEYVNEDERDEQEKNQMGDDPTAMFTLTPKGLFFMILTKYFGVMDMNDARVDPAWNDFEQWVRTYYGKGEFVGGIAFSKKGGEFVPMLPGPPPSDMDMDDMDED